MDQRDFLTQLLDRMAFDSFLELALDAAKNAAEPLSLIMVDIDHFKSVNDGRGHQIGDDVLRGVALRLQKVTGAKGEAFRYGGEEFAIVLLNHSSEEALAVAERARREIATTPMVGVPVTASFGVACSPDHASETATLVRAADQAMYDAKNRGRNLTRLYGDPPPAKQGPREPERRKPEAGRLTEDQKAQMRKRLLRHESIECPDDGAYFDVYDMTGVGSVGREFLITCPDCGMSDQLGSGRR